MKLKNFTDKLLDMSKSNRMINYKDSRYSNIYVMNPDIDTVFDRLMNDLKLEVFNIDKYLEMLGSGKSYNNEVIYDDLYPHIRDYIKDTNIVLYKTKASTFQTIKTINKKANEYLNEKGINILYMAFGFLNYEEDDCKYQAPLVMVPVKFVKSRFSYLVETYDDEAILNPTLKYKLKDTYKISLNEIGELSIKEYLEYVENIVSSYSFSVSHEMAIGIFSFMKLDMYIDLRDNESFIVKNPLVSAILGNGYKEPLKEDLSVYNVYDADHTQNEAIEAILKGESIVLEGPPGTGKSQTITNIISSLLANDKKVLFVSEKASALNVVYDKLKKANLEEFTLALHSNKTNKKEFINELYETINTPKTHVVKEAYETLERLSGTEVLLNDYVNLLHEKVELFNITPYQVFSRLAELNKINDFNLRIDNISTLGYKFYNSFLELFEKYVSYTEICGSDYRDFHFYGFKDLNKKNNLKNIELFKSIKQFLDRVLKNLGTIKRSINININSINEYKAICNFYGVIYNSKYNCERLYDLTHTSDYYKLAIELKNTSLEYNESFNVISKTSSTHILHDKYLNLYDELLSLKNVRFKIFNKKYKKIRKTISEVTINHKKLSFKKLLTLLEHARRCFKIESRFDLDAYSIKSILKDDYKKYDTDFDNLISTIKGILDASESIEDFKNIKSSNIDKEFYLECRDSLNDIKIYERLSDLYDSKLIDINTYSIKNMYLKINSSIKDYDYIDTWTKVLKLIEEFKKVNVLDILNKVLDNKVEPSMLIDTARKIYYSSVLDYLLENVNAFKNFNSLEMEKLVKEFINDDKSLHEINKAIIAEKIQKSRPNVDLITPKSPASIINREYQKKRKQMSVRELINSQSEFIQTIKPAFLMSPLSVSTYLESGKIDFDVVIFDEASQIFPEDAIGAIYRAKQLVVVGDSKQMPPSNFFGSITIEEEDGDEEDSSDFESILDICGSVFKKYRLSWHYRSQNEELIAFSNQHFYDSCLTTFPSARQKCEDFGLEFYKVDGVYNRKTRNNKVEALKVVELVSEHFKKYGNTRSLGVVAFSMAQQALIEKEIEASKIIIPDMEEGFFVKNLETVQGDERDTIIFSIGYGYDESGKFIQNFGPLNKDGGERRLNVAISRAKINVKVVSSILDTDIDISKSKMKGTELLKGYLKFSESPILIEKEREKTEIDFASEVRDFLVDNGYLVDYKVGFSRMKIDLCIKDPRTNDYILAIECDGDTYYNSKKCTDRNRLRREILERMGFRYFRVWSLGWYSDPKLSKTRLIEAINNLDDNLDSMSEVDFNEVITEDKTFETYEKALDEEILKSYKAPELDFERVVLEFLEKESPLSEELLMKRMLPLWHQEKLSTTVKNDFELFKAMYLDPNVVGYSDSFLFLKSKKITLRVPSPNDTPRDIKYISIPEIASGMKDIIKNNQSVVKDEMYKTLVSILGYKKNTINITKRLDEALEFLNKTSFIKIENDIITMLDI